MKHALLLAVLMFLVGCARENPKPEVDPAWACVLDQQERNDLARLKFYGPISMDDHVRYTEYKYRLGYFLRTVVPIADARELARLGIAVSVVGDSALRDPVRLRYLELQAFYGRYSSLSREESKELAQLKLRWRKYRDLPEKDTGRFRELSYLADNGLRTAE